MVKEELKAFRTNRLGLSQTKMAEWLGLQPRKATISNWETGKEPIPKWVELRIESELKK